LHRCVRAFWWVWVCVCVCESNSKISRPTKKDSFLVFPRWHERSRLTPARFFLGASVLTARRSLVSAQTASSGVAAAVVSRLYCFTALLLY
jgi:hypothetical protein